MLDTFFANHPLLGMFLVLAAIVVPSCVISTVSWHYRKKNAHPDEPECVGGKQNCRCTTYYECSLLD